MCALRRNHIFSPFSSLAWFVFCETENLPFARAYVIFALLLLALQCEKIGNQKYFLINLHFTRQIIVLNHLFSIWTLCHKITHIRSSLAVVTARVNHFGEYIPCNTIKSSEQFVLFEILERSLRYKVSPIELDYLAKLS